MHMYSKKAPVQPSWIARFHPRWPLCPAPYQQTQISKLSKGWGEDRGAWTWQHIKWWADGIWAAMEPAAMHLPGTQHLMCLLPTLTVSPALSIRDCDSTRNTCTNEFSSHLWMKTFSCPWETCLCRMGLAKGCTVLCSKIFKGILKNPSSRSSASSTLSDIWRMGISLWTWTSERLEQTTEILSILDKRLNVISKATSSICRMCNSRKQWGIRSHGVSAGGILAGDAWRANDRF